MLDLSVTATAAMPPSTAIHVIAKVVRAGVMSAAAGRVAGGTSRATGIVASSVPLSSFSGAVPITGTSFASAQHPGEHLAERGANASLRGPAAFLEPRVRQHVLDEVGEAPGLFLERVEVDATLLVVLDHAVCQHLRVHTERRQRRPQLVCDGRREPVTLLAEGDA